MSFINKIYILVILSFFSLKSTGQINYAVSTTDTTLYGDPNTTDPKGIYGDIPLSNTKGSTLPMNWKVIENSLLTGWTFSVCDPQNCHPVGTTSSAFNLPVSGLNNLINVHFYANGILGVGLIKIQIKDPGQNDSTTLTFRLNASATSLIDNQAANTKVKVFPNPVFQNGSVSVSALYTKGEINVYNSLGMLVYTKKITSQLTRANISGLSKGIYSMVIKQEKSKLSAIRKLVIN